VHLFGGCSILHLCGGCISMNRYLSLASFYFDFYSIAIAVVSLMSFVINRFYSCLNIKQRVSIFHVILGNDAHGFEHSLVPVNTMAKAIFKNIETFEPCIKAFMAGSNPPLEIF
jgi:hypothetical protein